MTAAATRPAEPPEGADPEELIDAAQKLLEHHDEQEQPEEAARSLWRCRDVLLGPAALSNDRAPGPTRTNWPSPATCTA